MQSTTIPGRQQAHLSIILILVSGLALAACSKDASRKEDLGVEAEGVDASVPASDANVGSEAGTLNDAMVAANTADACAGDVCVAPPPSCDASAGGCSDGSSPSSTRYLPNAVGGTPTALGDNQTYAMRIELDSPGYALRYRVIAARSGGKLKLAIYSDESGYPEYAIRWVGTPVRIFEGVNFIESNRLDYLLEPGTYWLVVVSGTDRAAEPQLPELYTRSASGQALLEIPTTHINLGWDYPFLAGATEALDTVLSVSVEIVPQ